MEILTSYYTDIGTKKRINQDSLLIEVANSVRGKVAFALVCDGAGGLEHGELASKEGVVVFHDWFASDFAHMMARDNVSEELLYQAWEKQVKGVNKKLGKYADKQGWVMGTTLTMLLVCQHKYYICHVGDSRIYRVDDVVQKITEDQTLVAQEVRNRLITEEQAKKDSRRNILLQCVGATKDINPQFGSGVLEGDTTFILCSDGFYHMVTEDEIFENFKTDMLKDKEQITRVCKDMTKLAMSRGERDNITVIGIVVKFS